MIHLKQKTKLKSLPRISDRATFIYVEHVDINRQDGAITVSNDRGIVKIPVAIIGVLLLGPGTNITHRAAELIGEMGTSMVWVGENGVRQYACGRPLAHSTKFLEKQAELVSNKRKRLNIARRMYQIRFPNENVTTDTMQQLRGKEGARVRKIYRQYAKKYKISWSGRSYDIDDFHGGDPVNKALSVANVCLYGLVHSVIVALGMSPGLGFVHTGHDKSFVYDIADLYKADYTIPLAFEIAANYDETKDDISSITRHKMRNLFSEKKLAREIIKDIKNLFDVQDIETEFNYIMGLWDEKEELVSYGVNYLER